MVVDVEVVVVGGVVVVVVVVVAGVVVVVVVGAVVVVVVVGAVVVVVGAVVVVVVVVDELVLDVEVGVVDDEVAGVASALRAPTNGWEPAVRKTVVLVVEDVVEVDGTVTTATLSELAESWTFALALPVSHTSPKTVPTRKRARTARMGAASANCTRKCYQ